LPKSAHRCIASWRRFFPDYEIKEWNEDNFDVNIIPFTQEAYSVKNYAYVSDYARLWILSNYGGIYFDTDVEVIKDMTATVDNGSFMGIEKYLASPDMSVNLGLGFSVNRTILKDIMNYYENTRSAFDQIPNIVSVATGVLVKYGFNHKNEIQQVGGFTVYPYDYFCPREYPLGKLEITANTLSIHHYSESWMSLSDKMKMRLIIILRNKIGSWIRKLIRNNFFVWG
jgi:hypothetical protein